MNHLLRWGPVVAVVIAILGTVPLGPTVAISLYTIGQVTVLRTEKLPGEIETLDFRYGPTAVALEDGRMFLVPTEGAPVPVPVPPVCTTVRAHYSKSVCVGGDAGFFVVEEEELAQPPTVRGPVTLPGRVVDADIAGTRVIAADNLGWLGIYEVVDQAIVELGRVRVAEGGVSSLRLVGRLALVGLGTDGVVLVDLLNPSAPTELSRLAIDGYVHHLTSAGGTGYAAAGDGGLVIIDLSDSGRPSVMTVLDLGGPVVRTDPASIMLIWAMVEGRGAVPIAISLPGFWMPWQPDDIEARAITIAGPTPSQPVAMPGGEVWFVDAMSSRDLVIYLVGALFGSIALGVLAWVAVRRPRGWVLRLFWIVAGLAAMIWILWGRFGQPIEVLHCVEYAALGVLLYRAVVPLGPGLATAVLAASIGLFAGLLDETFQWLLPNRTGDFEDVILDAQAVAIGVLVAWRAVFLLTRSRPPSWVPTLATSAAALVACAAFLHVTVGFGYHHDGPANTTLYSRLPLEELARVDREQGAENARILGATAAMNYREFMKAYSSVAEPFLYELRVRLFRRDRRLEKNDLPVACGEDRIIEGLYARSIAGTHYVWPQAMKERCASHTEPYASPVSEEIVTWTGPVGLWGTTGLLGIVLLGAAGYLWRRAEKPS